MQRYILGRGIQSVVCVVVVVTLVFFSSRLAGDPLILLLPLEATKAEVAHMRAYLGLDKPMLVQYGLFLSKLIKGDLGRSMYFRMPVTEILRLRFPATAQLGGAAILISLLIALPVGVYSAVKRGTRLDLVARTFAMLGQSLPSFWLGIMLILIAAVWLGVLPAGGRAGPSSVILPALAMGWAVAAGIMRLTRSSMLDVLDSEYVKLARIKGLRESVVIWKHCFKNALLPVVTFSVLLFGHVLAGSVVTETVFAWPGVGRLLIQAVMQRDFALVQGVALLLGVIFIAGNFIVDILYAYLNPKIRYGGMR